MSRMSSEDDLALRVDGGQLADEPANEAGGAPRAPAAGPQSSGPTSATSRNGRQAAPSSRPKLPPKASIVTCSPIGVRGVEARHRLRVAVGLAAAQIGHRVVDEDVRHREHEPLGDERRARGPRPAITGIQNEAMISATDPQRSNGGVRQETRSKPPRSSSTFEPSER